MVSNERLTTAKNNIDAFLAEPLNQKFIKIAIDFAEKQNISVVELFLDKYAEGNNIRKLTTVFREQTGIDRSTCESIISNYIQHYFALKVYTQALPATC